VDLFELNEAFAAQSVAVIRELHIDPEKVLVYLIILIRYFTCCR
jgi:acetyl-CoA acetyltransferase